MALAYLCDRCGAASNAVGSRGSRKPDGWGTISLWRTPTADREQKTFCEPCMDAVGLAIDGGAS